MNISTRQLLQLVSASIGWGGLGLVGGCQPDTAPNATAASAARVWAAGRPDLATASLPAASQQPGARLDTLPPAAWSKVRRVELYESLEGGDAVFYYQHRELRKIVARYLGETGQQRTIFYLRGGQPTLVLEQAYQYNRPITYDSAAMRANADTEAFDLAKSTIQTTRSYFDRGHLRYQATSPVNDSAAHLLREQRRLIGQLHHLVAQAAAEK